MPNEVQGYNANPTYDGLGKSPHFLGVELEVEVTGEFDRDTSAKTVKKILNEERDFRNYDRKDFAICKSDGSIRYGFEICTRPASLKIQKEKWGQFFDVFKCGDYAKDRKGKRQNARDVKILNGLKSQDTTTCGMHIHLSKYHPDGTPIMSQGQQKKLTVFFNAKENLKFMQSISGRGSFYGGSYDATKTMKSRQMRRTEAVNFQKEKTAEIRTFIGTLEEDYFFKNLEFAAAIKDFTRDKFLSWEKMSHGNFIRWIVKKEKLYPYLVRFIHQNAFDFLKASELWNAVGRKSYTELESLKDRNKRTALGYRLHFELSRLEDYPQFGSSQIDDKYSGVIRRGSYNVASRIDVVDQILCARESTERGV